jgi:PhzF family phenazine biosynthesis protein
MRRFTQIDVFTDEFMLGNPVAVVHDADDLSTEQMASFARWTNLVETAFLLQPTTVEADYRVRIFTPTDELPFAGHPTLGTARAWLEAAGSPEMPGLVQECAAGLVRVRRDGARLAFAAPPIVRGGPVSRGDQETIARALGIEFEAIVDAQWVDNGPGWVGVLLASAGEVLDLNPDRNAFGRFTSVGVIGRYPGGSEPAFEVRAFIPGIGLGEDPVTGSLNASLAQWLIRTDRAPTSYVAAQGSRLGRRGRVRVDQVDDDVWVGGDTVVAITGDVAL